jgi:hypothetical protein
MPERLILRRQPHQPDRAAWLASLGNPDVRDIYHLQVAELAEIRLPGGTRQARDDFTADYTASEPGVWSYYPWLHVALRTVEPAALYELRTNRNRNLVTTAEQSVLRQAKVAIAGLSVGSNIASALAHHGIGGTYFLADRDDLATSNLNRTQARLLDVGLPKCQLAARALLELDPFAACVLYPGGLDDASADPFVAGSDIVFDEVDDFRIKVKLRLAARAHGKPLLMATNLADSVLIDIERWDLRQDGLEPFNGQLDGVSLDDLMRPDLRPEQVSRFAAQVIGVGNVPLRALASLPLIGGELAGRPQVASTSSMAAGVAAMAARSVLLDAPLASGRYRVSLTDVLGLPDDHGSADQRAAVLASLAPAGPRPELPDPRTLASDGPDTALRRLATYATLAPSPHNTQPWRFHAADGRLTISPDPARALAVADPSGRALVISLGCAAMGALIAAAAAGLGAIIDFEAESNVRLGLAGTEADHDLARLFPALTSRVTDKRGYPPDPVEPPMPAMPTDIELHYVATPQARAVIADLHRQAVAELARTGSFASELAGWLRTDPADPRRDGMLLPPPVGAAVIAALRNSGEPLIEMGERDARALAAGPLIGLLTSQADTPAAWLRAGLGWLRLALTAQQAGLAVAPLTAIVENPVTRAAAAALAAPGQHIQILFRLGKSPGRLPPTARREPLWVPIPG